MEEFYFTEIRSGAGLFYSPQCSSTNALAESCSEVYGKDKAIGLYTFHQTAGRGQGNHTWESEPGKNLALTLRLPSDPFNNAVLLNKAITLGVRKALENLSGLKTFIKWPNDIMITDKKISGLLIEVASADKTTKAALAGVGINVNQAEWQGNFNATSLLKETGKEYSLLNVLHEVVDSIIYYKNILDFFKIENEFNQFLWKKEETMVLNLMDQAEISGQLTGVDHLGRICIQTETGMKSFHHGEARIKT